MVSNNMPPVAILAGGLATRLHPRTTTLPKALVSVAGEPFIAHQLRLLRREGIHHVVLCVAHLGEMIRDFVSDGRQFGLEVAYSFDGPTLIGTGGALRRALPLLGETFFVLYGDSYLDVALAPILLAFRRSGAPALMTVLRNDGRWDTSNVLFDGAHVVRYDKRAPTSDMRYIDYGLGILSDNALSGWNTGLSFDLADVYAKLAAGGRLAGYEVTRRFYEIGTPEGLAETDTYLKGTAMSVSDYTNSYYEEVAAVAKGIDQIEVDRMIDILVEARTRGGRLFILGVGGGAGHAGHAVNDFRKICGIEAYAPTDNVSELTARVNDEGWETVFANWLKGSRCSASDLVFVFSVVGGALEKNVSPNLVRALQYAKEVGARVLGVVGRDGGHTAIVGDAVSIVPTVNPDAVTPHSEAFQAVIWHLLITHPLLKTHQTKWEATR